MEEKEIKIEDSDMSANTSESVAEGGEFADSETNVTENATEEKDPLESAKEEISELKDKYLRSVAEFDNYRKRTLKEKAELILNGGEKTVAAILPVLDDMERAIANGEKQKTYKYCVKA